MTSNGNTKRITFLFVLLLAFIEPQLFKTEGFELGDSIYDVLRVIAGGITFFIYVRNKVSALVIASVILQSWIAVSTIINGGSLIRFVGPAVNMIATIMLFEMALEIDIRRFLQLIRNTLSLYVLINLATCALRAVGVINWSATFLGIDNRWFYFLLPWVVYSALCAYLEKGTLTIGALTSYILALAQLIVVWSVGAMIALISIPLYILVCNIIKKTFNISINHIYSILLLLSINLLLVGGQLIPQLSEMIREVLGKDGTFSGRVFLWAIVVAVLYKSPLFGNGVQSELYDINYFYINSGYYPACAVNHPHNFILNYAYHGGVPAALGFVIIYIYSIFHLRSSSKICLLLASAFVSFFVASLVDTLDFSLMYSFLPLAVGLNGLEKASEKTRRQKVDR